ncbi:MAG: 7-cyano-7-deazaguanine synthase QueC [Candidatus Heimdallarchaeaceae archaeon]
MTKAIVLFSGGLDSTACLYWALQNYDEVTLFSFLYGSKEDSVIQRTNEKFASLLSIPSKIISLPFLEDFIRKSGSALSLSSEKLPDFKNFEELDDMEITIESAKSVWVPARNLLFLSIAASAADSEGEPVDILFGANREEGQTFPDNTPEFIHKMNSAMELGCLNKVKVIAPFSNSVKKEIVLFLTENNAQYEYSSSCYQIKGWTSDGCPIHCGECESCLRRKRAFLKANKEDKTHYVEE